jgi:hypothetical protein
MHGTAVVSGLNEQDVSGRSLLNPENVKGEQIWEETASLKTCLGNRSVIRSVKTEKRKWFFGS